MKNFERNIKHHFSLKKISKKFQLLQNIRKAHKKPG